MYNIYNDRERNVSNRKEVVRMTKKVKTYEEFLKIEEEKAEKMKRRNVYRSLMVLKAESANIVVTEDEIDQYIRTHSK